MGSGVSQSPVNQMPNRQIPDGENTHPEGRGDRQREGHRDQEWGAQNPDPQPPTLRRGGHSDEERGALSLTPNPRREHTEREWGVQSNSEGNGLRKKTIAEPPYVRRPSVKKIPSIKTFNIDPILSTTPPPSKKNMVLSIHLEEEKWPGIITLYIGEGLGCFSISASCLPKFVHSLR